MLPKKKSEAPFLKIIDIVIPAYNSHQTIFYTIQSTLEQELPSNWITKIIIADDGSSDKTAQYCISSFKEKIQIVSHKNNQGRSTARNTGWKSGSGKYVVFIDADCQWDSKYALATHLEMLESGADVSTAGIISYGNGFWSTYQNLVQSDREKDFSAGNLASFTSANFAIRRSVLCEIGGFDENYKYYGFEDRDLLLRAIYRGAKVVFNPDALVVHEQDLSLKGICQKMTEAGQYSAGRFQATHPIYYYRTPYGRIEYKINGFFLTTLSYVSRPMIPWLSGFGDKIIRIPGLPFFIKKTYVKILSGLAFLTGVYQRKNT